MPHAIELMQVDYDKLFTVFRSQPEVEVLVSSFISAFQNEAMEQLEGQIASARISMARLSSPNLYYVLSGSDFTLDINSPTHPKIVCAGNNPAKQHIYGAVLSLFTSRLVRLVNRKGGLKSSLIFDEFPTLYFSGIDGLMATARANLVATCLGIQDYSQLKKDYGRDQGEVITNIAGNMISGQVMGDTAKQLSERFGKIMQDRESLSINRQDISVTKNKQLEVAVPPSKIASLSSGEFVGMVADDPMQKIELKAFCAAIINDHKALAKEQKEYKELPQFSNVKPEEVCASYLRVKREVTMIVQKELERMMDTPELNDLIVRKGGGD